MLSLLLLGAAAAASPLQARLVATDLQRTSSSIVTWQNRIDVEFASKDARTMRLCPEDASVNVERLAGGQYRPEDRFGAHAMRMGSDYVSSCRDVALSPNAPQTVSFYVRGIRRGGDRYVTTIDADGERFAFFETRQD